MRFERWFAPILCLLASVLLHVGIALLGDRPGANGTSTTATELEVSLVGRGQAAGGSGGASHTTPSARRAVEPQRAPQPFERPPWLPPPVASPMLGQQRQIAIAPKEAPSTRPIAPSGFQSFGVYGGGQGAGHGGTGGSGTGGGGAPGLPGPRILTTRSGETPMRQVVIPDYDRFAPRRVQHTFQRARPLTESNPPVQYPEEARAHGLRGTVYLKVTVTPDGRAESVELLLTSKAQVLDEAAIAAVKDWAFEPARTESGPVKSVISVPIVYSPN